MTKANQAKVSIKVQVGEIIEKAEAILEILEGWKVKARIGTEIENRQPVAYIEVETSLLNASNSLDLIKEAIGQVK